MTLYAHKNSIDVELMGDNNNWYKWLVLKPSKIPDAGNGLFTARAFLDGDVITKYLGNVTNRLEKVKTWKKDQEISAKFKTKRKGSDRNLSISRSTGSCHPPQTTGLTGSCQFAD